MPLNLPHEGTRPRSGRLAVSNIAWPAEADAWAASTLPGLGVSGVEIAPARVCQDPLAATGTRVADYRAFWEGHGLPIVAMQALLYGRPDLTIFVDRTTRGRTLEYLTGIIDLAAALGARRLVFGSPRNRLRGSLTHAEAVDQALPFFRELGRRADDHGVIFCIEPNPVDYGCDFLVDSTAAADFVATVGHRGFGLHLDTGGMTLASECPESILAVALPHWRHFHASEPSLVPLGTGGADHHGIGEALRSTPYGGWISIETSLTAAGDAWQESLIASIATARSAYIDETISRRPVS